MRKLSVVVLGVASVASAAPKLKEKLVFGPPDVTATSTVDAADPQFAAYSADAAEPAHDEESLELCIIETLAKLRFPAPKGGPAAPKAVPATAPTPTATPTK